MTILSKKKAPPAKPEEASEQALTSNHANPLPIGSIPSHSQINDRGREERRGSPLRWQVNGREEHQHHNFEEFEGDSSNSHKRRHRSSPLRNPRGPKHRDRAPPNSPSQCPNSSSSPVAGPSTETCGYNSGDEYDYSHKAKRTEAQWIEEDKTFEKKMRKRGFSVKKMGEDGACLFRAVADQVYGDQDMHAIVRKNCMDYIALNSDYFSQYVTEDFNTYVNRKRLDCTHGNHIEMQAMSEIYNRRIEVFCYGKDPINIFFGNHKNDNEPIRLSYQRGSHYNSIVDPHKATIGVGLGLPNYQPGLAEATLMKDAVRQSEDLHIEQAMLEDKLRATDWEATNEAIEEQVARDSYLQYLRDNEKRQQSLKCEAGNTSADTTDSTPSVSPSKVEKPVEPGESSKVSTNQSSPPNFYSMLPPQMFGLSEWEDAGILAQVLAESQQEYLDNLKKAHSGASEEEEEEASASCQPSTSS